MANFMKFFGEHGYEQINVDLIRGITEDMDGNNILHFDATDKRVLKGQEARQFKDDYEREWREKLKKALRPDKGGQAA
jgi:hypothetical protein